MTNVKKKQGNSLSWTHFDHSSSKVGSVEVPARLSLLVCRRVPFQFVMLCQCLKVWSGSYEPWSFRNKGVLRRPRRSSRSKVCHCQAFDIDSSHCSIEYVSSFVIFTLKNCAFSISSPFLWCHESAADGKWTFNLENDLWPPTFPNIIALFLPLLLSPNVRWVFKLKGT